jgi:hypothetical protein
MIGRNSILLGSLGAAALAACSPYDPDLAAVPYQCAAQEPRCPNNYTCMENGSETGVCVVNGGVAPDAPPDGLDGFKCADDGRLEPNNKISEAFVTDVGTGAPMRVFGPLSVCPEADQDHFQVTIVTPNRGIEVITRWEGGLPISSALLNEAGTPIANGIARGTSAIRACATNLPVGIYYGRALSNEGLKNNYRIEIRVVDNCL